MKNKEKINSIFELVWKYGVGFTLLLIGGVFMIVASKKGGAWGDYPEFLNIGITIMSFGIAAYSVNEVKIIILAQIELHKTIMNNRFQIKMARINKGEVRNERKDQRSLK